MKNKPIIIVGGEPKSIFLEIFFKALKIKKYKSPIILISSLKLIQNQMKILNIKKNINVINFNNLSNIKKNKNFINLINIEYKKRKNQKNIANSFIENSFKKGFELLSYLKTYKLINGPISKKEFLKKKFPGITEYLAKKSKIKQIAMLIYNENLSVCPLTTHVPLKEVTKKITEENIKEKVYLITEFYKKYRKISPKIAVVGLNPHCETIDKFSEDENIILPTINKLKKKGFKISGPYSADTIFLKQNRTKYDVILGMYHDQVLTPIKTIYEYDAINITLGLPYIRISPDHGPNKQMFGKNLSNPLSLIKAISFLDKV
ncbi:4-hydroxythreonine-4-phosphate dehydrogenase PdxA [Candidatus Pelagibacter sp. HIMB1506]|uniref:4-hydroxythreonine-4-phosphate dehydrogenase PdxA n=1 Tax=Candidatus Pelagibacter sp. HIMB1506 TaxID=3413337 RepID=UPI003F86107E